MSFLESRELPQPRITPEVFIGAASPLWAVVGGAAMGGVAYWWMTRWMQPENLETLFGMAAWAPARAAEAVEPIGAAAIDQALEQVAPMGGEAAPISPLAAAATPEIAPEPAAFAEPAQEEPPAKPRRVTPPAAPPETH